MDELEKEFLLDGSEDGEVEADLESDEEEEKVDDPEAVDEV
jgi:hypothetical protein